jgi:hypothetical protein
MTENIAVLAPIPSASVITATAVNPGFLPSCRSAYRMSWSRLVISVSFFYSYRAPVRADATGGRITVPSSEGRSPRHSTKSLRYLPAADFL